MRGGARKAVAAGALIAVTALAACGKPEYEEPISVLFVDTSLSTGEARNSTSGYERAAVQAARGTAGEIGTLYAGAATENTVGNSSWQVQKTFTCGFPDNEKLCRPDARQQVPAIEPELTQLVRSPGAGGSDLLGALQMAGRLFADYPQRNRDLVFLTDGDINTPGFRLYSELPMAPTQMDARVEELRRSGSLPHFDTGKEPVRVWLGGLGYGLPDPERANQVIQFWERLIPATGGKLEVADSSPRLTGFP